MIWSAGGSGENEVGHKQKMLSFFSLCFCDSLFNSVQLHFLAKKFMVLWEVISCRQQSGHTSIGLPKDLDSSSLPFSHACKERCALHYQRVIFNVLQSHSTTSSIV